MSIIGGETIGTGLLILLGDGVVAAVLLNKSKAQNSGWIVITWGWAIGVMTGAYAVGQFTGAHLNPAVTFGLWVNGNIDGGDVPKYLIGEMLGAMAGAALVVAAYWDHFRETEDPGLKLAVFSTGPAVRNYPLNFVTEVIATFVLVFGILAIVGNQAIGLGQGQSGLNLLLVALLVLGIGLSLGGPTGYAINPARDLGPRIVHAILPIPGKGTSDWAYAWVPVLGPLAGGVLGGFCYWWWFPG